MADTATMTTARTEPVLVTLPAEIDMANAHAIGAQLAAATAVGGRIVIADMTATTFCDSTGMGMLVRACRSARTSGAELRLLVTSASILRVIAILGLDAVLPLYHGLDQALAGPATHAHRQSRTLPPSLGQTSPRTRSAPGTSLTGRALGPT